ncbi:hypothetical protein Glove_137g156 [Diversispora epigaea]|uniref:Uncharacterized protein n=1 Tax=Diversispora epigaea TaxID=1348612 RepID=A0A397J0Y5_9GLOM|nr:hypothetical protein Glove_137g156 [Diversispora epigaea]
MRPPMSMSFSKIFLLSTLSSSKLDTETSIETQKWLTTNVKKLKTHSQLKYIQITSRNNFRNDRWDYPDFLLIQYWCGNIQNIGGSEVYNCQNYKTVMDQDENRARGIFLWALLDRALILSGDHAVILNSHA